MGHKKVDTFESSNHRLLERVIYTLIDTQIALLDFSLLNIVRQKEQAKADNNADEYEKLSKLVVKYKKGKRECYKMQLKLSEITKIEVLQSIYVNLISGKEVIWAYAPALVHQGVYFCTKKGYAEFLKIQKEEQEKALAKIKERQAVEKAIKDGKQVENVLIDGKLKQVVVDENKAN